MAIRTARTFLELSTSQEAEVEALVDLNVPTSETRLRLVAAPAGASGADEARINEASRAVTTAKFRWDRARANVHGADDARAAFVAALIAAGVPAR